MTSNASVSSVLPVVTIVEYLILLVLITGPKHGYGIMQEIAAYTNKEVNLVPGTLYGALKRMLKAEWIEESTPLPAADLDNERRRFYRLSSLGHKTLLTEIKRMEFLSREGRSRLESATNETEIKPEESNDPPDLTNSKLQLVPTNR